jgi:hypothetical protein
VVGIVVVGGTVVVVTVGRAWGRLESEPVNAQTAPVPATMNTAVTAPMIRVRVHVRRIGRPLSFAVLGLVVSASPALSGHTDRHPFRIALETGEVMNHSGNMGCGWWC